MIGISKKGTHYVNLYQDYHDLEPVQIQLRTGLEEVLPKQGLTSVYTRSILGANSVRSVLKAGKQLV